MSLDVYLRPKVQRKTTCHCCGSEIDDDEADFSANYTHNAGQMANKAGIYGVVWRPEENGIATASDLIQPLTVAIQHMPDNEPDYLPLQPTNGWGDYDSFLDWLRRYRNACIEYPDSLVSVSR